MTSLFHFGRYVSVAVLSAASDWIVFTMLVSVFSAHHLSSLMAARLVGGLVSFFSNRYWTWGANRHIAVTQQGRRFLVLYAISYGVSIALFQILGNGIGIPVYPAKLATDAGCFLFNYLAMQVYVFSHRQGFLAHAMDFLSSRRN